MAIVDIKLECTHNPGKDNVKADILSRVFERWLVNDHLFGQCTWWPVSCQHTQMCLFNFRSSQITK